MMQELNWQCKSRHFRNVCPNNKFFKLINKPSTQEKPLISTARIQNMHICTVQRVHPCFDKIATILAKQHQRAQRSLQMQHPPYELLVPRNVDGQSKELGRF